MERRYQKRWPQRVTTGSCAVSKQMLHSNAGEAGDPPLSSLVVDDADSMRRLCCFYFCWPKITQLLSLALSLSLSCSDVANVVNAAKIRIRLTFSLFR
jgi:hypothetical protein